MSAFKETTSTTLVTEALEKADDFMTAKGLQQATGRNVNQVSAALHALRQYKVVEAINSEGQLFWYATPWSDTRTKVVYERSPETKPRKQRRRKVKE